MRGQIGNLCIVLAHHNLRVWFQNMFWKLARGQSALEAETSLTCFSGAGPKGYALTRLSQKVLVKGQKVKNMVYRAVSC